MTGVNAKLKSDADTPDMPEVPRGISMANALPQRQARPSHEQAYVADTPRVNYFGPDQTLTQVFRDAEAAEDFAADNQMRRARAPKVSNRDNTHAYRDSYNAQNRPNDPMHREQFTRTTHVCKAKLDGPLTLEKCLTFQKDVLDFCDTAVRTKYVLHVTSPVSLLTQTSFHHTFCTVHTVHTVCSLTLL